MRRLAIPLVATALALVAFCASPVVAAAKPNYLKLANDGIYSARVGGFWNSHELWYNVRLNDGDQYPLATVWDIVPLMEAIDGRALADRSKTNKKYAGDHAKFAERYWNGDLAPHGGYSPYPGDHGADNHVWFDDNSWWGQQFVDAYRATHNKRFIGDAKRASDFIDARGWSGGGRDGGMWWETQYQARSLEALASATALTAEIYELTHNKTYRDRAHKYISWADQNARGRFSLYENATQPIMTYVEGSMIGANLALCNAGEKGRCKRAEELADSVINWYGWYPYPDQCVQTDTIMFRYLIQLSAHDKNPRWWDWAKKNAVRAMNHAGTGNGLYLNFWDGSSPNDPKNSGCQDSYGQIKVHGAPIEIFAWLAAFPRP